MLTSHYQNAGQNYSIKIANGAFENVAKFRFLRMTVTNQNWINELIRSGFNLGNTWLFSSEPSVFSTAV
jgi:hypothetical protein